jgi:hypothetical protein
MTAAVEKAGVAIIINQERLPRLMTITIRTSPLPTIMRNVYAPKACANGGEKTFFIRTNPSAKATYGRRERETDVQTTGRRTYAEAIRIQPDGFQNCRHVGGSPRQQEEIHGRRGQRERECDEHLVPKAAN